MRRALFTLPRGASPRVLLNRQRVEASSLSSIKRSFHATTHCKAVKPYLLADIGEGITECQIINWFVKPGDTVSQFDPICEVQSDKASVEITSRYDGTIQKIHYAVDDMAAVGSPLLEIDVEGEDGEVEVSQKDLESNTEEVAPKPSEMSQGPIEDSAESITTKAEPDASSPTEPKNSGLAMPSVRHLLKEHNLNLIDITATGKGGRVLKEDVLMHLAENINAPTRAAQPKNSHPATPTEDVTIPLTPIQNQMFQSMTQSLSIPHFLYTQVVDMTGLTALRKRCMSNTELKAQLSHQIASESSPKLTPLPFILKALSRAVKKYPTLNSTLDTNSGSRPQLTLKGSHNIGIAMDTPTGLVVPVIKDVQNHSIMSLAAEIERLSALGKQGRLSPADLRGATMVVSNIGSIGGHVVSPIIMSPMVMILGVGRSQNVPAFHQDADGNEVVAKREQVILSWSADHRVLDGATVARCAEEVSSWLENVEALGLVLS